MTPKVFKINVLTSLVVTAMDDAEAAEAARKFTTIDGTEQTFAVVEIHHKNELPKGWKGTELAFSMDPNPPYGQASIQHWLSKKEKKNES